MKYKKPKVYSLINISVKYCMVEVYWTETNLLLCHYLLHVYIGTMSIHSKSECKIKEND